MQTLTLLIRAYERSQVGMINELLKSEVEGLRVNLEAQSLDFPGWVRVTVSGEDEKTAMNYLAREFGQSPERLESLQKFSMIKGRMMALDIGENEITVDIGALLPLVGAKVPLFRLQGQLADGRKVELKRLAELFGFCKGLPLAVKVLNVSVGEGRVESMLAQAQISQYMAWTKCYLDRLIVIGASVHEVTSALRRAECSRDVADLERLGLLECAVVCKLGTDAVGLIPKVGRQLRTAAFSVFSPKRLLSFFGRDSPFLLS
jgi:hypothetical protein